MPMKPRDIISSAIFYTGLVGATLLLVHLGTKYGIEKVPQDFTRMQPRLERGGHLFVNKRARDPETLDYGDIIMYRRPLWKRASYEYEFARVVGKPGDVVELTGSKLYRSERREGKLEAKQPVSESYLNPRDRPGDFSPLIVPRNTVLVLFDSRDHREPLRDFLVPARAIHGRVVR
ncbi:MAG TPA: signal peptidase I [Planctomycetota bacterium]|nr:signal peptidase I [Planctomycetota bacterium]